MGLRVVWLFLTDRRRTEFRPQPRALGAGSGGLNADSRCNRPVGCWRWAVTGSKIYQAKIESIQTLSEAIKHASTEIVRNPRPGDEGVAMHAHFNKTSEQQAQLI
jgi:hypothetical protein